MRVSVILCTYQGERFLAEQLQSTFAQTWRPDEIIVSDDASTDATIAIAEKMLRSSGIAYELHANAQNLGFRQNFAQAMQRASGDILFLSDQDDVWHPEKIARMLLPFERPETVMAFHDAALVDSRLQPLAPSFWRTMSFDSAPFQKKDYHRLLVSNVVQGSASAFRRSLLADALPIPDCAIHDEWLALFAALRGGLVPVPDVLMQYRQNEGNAIGAGAVTMRRQLSWLRHFREKIEKSHQELCRRRDMIGACRNRWNGDASASRLLALVEAYTQWLSKRDDDICRGVPKILLHGIKYVSMMRIKKLAFKAWCKDLMAAHLHV